MDLTGIWRYCSGSGQERLKGEIEKLCNQYVQENRETKLLYAKGKWLKFAIFVPEYIPEGKPARVVMYGDFGVPAAALTFQNSETPPCNHSENQNGTRKHPHRLRC